MCGQNSVRSPTAAALLRHLVPRGLYVQSAGVSKAQLAAAVAEYNSTVVSAARDVATQALTAQQIAARRKEQSAQITANERLLATAQARAHQGVRDAREGLAAAAQLLQQQDDAASLQAQAVSTDLALIKALGGGYRSPGEISNTSQTFPSPSNSNPSGDDAHERH